MGREGIVEAEAVAVGKGSISPIAIGIDMEYWRRKGCYVKTDLKPCCFAYNSSA